MGKQKTKRTSKIRHEIRNENILSVSDFPRKIIINMWANNRTCLIHNAELNYEFFKVYNEIWKSFVQRETVRWSRWTKYLVNNAKWEVIIHICYRITLTNNGTCLRDDVELHPASHTMSVFHYLCLSVN